MSKKKIYNKHLEKGRFYIHSDVTRHFYIRNAIERTSITSSSLLLLPGLKGSNLNTASNQLKSVFLLFTKILKRAKGETWGQDH